MIRVICILLNLFVLQEIQAQDADVMLSQSDKKFFIENKGQWPSDVLYLTRIGGLDAWITKQGVVYDFYKLKEKPETGNIDLERMHKHHEKFEYREYERYGHMVKINNTNVNSSIMPEGKEKQQCYYNYFIGSDTTKWASYVGLYKEAVIKNIYTGISQRWYFAKGGLRYDYIIEPGADYRQIQINIEGAENYCIKDNELLFTTRFGEVKQTELLVYQNLCGKKIPINAKWLKQENIISFEISNYDKTLPLIIDPLIYSTFIGGSGVESGSSLAIDNSGNAYITGETASTNYPATVGAYDQTHNGYRDIFVTKLNSNGSALLFSTFIGGNINDYCSSIAIDNSGNAYITGATSSSDYPTTAGAYDQTFSGSIDVLVTKLNSNGTVLLYSTFIGGSNYDFGYALALDSLDNVYITGITESDNYPTTPSTYNQTHNGSQDIFVTKLNFAGTVLLYSTFIGGNINEYCYSIAIDNSGNAYITGATTSSNYPTTAGAYDQMFSGSIDVFVTKLNPNGTALLYSTFIGGSADDHCYSITIDNSGNIYITGFTDSSDYPTTAGAYDQTHNGQWDVFVTKLNSDGSALLYSTFIGGSGDETNFFSLSLDLAIDNSDNTYITGATTSTDYPTTVGAYDQTHNGNWDIFFTKLNSAGSALFYSTFIGGNVNEDVPSLAIDNSGNTYIMGVTWSSDYPTTAGAYDQIHNGNGDIFVTKLSGITGGISDIPYFNNFNIFPNPSNGAFVIEADKPAVFELIDVTGRVIKTFNVNNRNFTVNEKLSEGIYFIKELNSSRTIKLIVEETSN